ncbi:MAG: hypothetical protein Ct9H300mP12_13530 [Acidimicrobiales bacterium]|nr:MAG: hypothetical protein Ct9H300mP12_13530 [Acidimicrobiales bacterium]
MNLGREKRLPLPGVPLPGDHARWRVQRLTPPDLTDVRFPPATPPRAIQTSPSGRLPGVPRQAPLWRPGRLHPTPDEGPPDLGHHVEVLAGPPYPVLDERVRLITLPSLELFNDHFPMRKARIWEMKSKWDVAEAMSFNTGNFSEPMAFSMRAWEHLRARGGEFDLGHDNQCLGGGYS